MWMRTSNGQQGQALLFSKSPKIRSTVTAATAPKIRRDISGISRRTFLNVRNQEGSDEILNNCDELPNGQIVTFRYLLNPCASAALILDQSGSRPQMIFRDAGGNV